MLMNHPLALYGQSSHKQPPLIRDHPRLDCISFVCEALPSGWNKDNKVDLRPTSSNGKPLPHSSV